MYEKSLPGSKAKPFLYMILPGIQDVQLLSKIRCEDDIVALNRRGAQDGIDGFNKPFHGALSLGFWILEEELQLADEASPSVVSVELATSRLGEQSARVDDVADADRTPWFGTAWVVENTI